MQQIKILKHELVERIITINRAWKVALDNITRASESEKKVCKNIAYRLQLQKSNWQAILIRSYPDQVWLKIDEDEDYSEPLYSVRFGTGFMLKDMTWKVDAEHLPQRLAEQMLTKAELKLALQPK